MCMKFSCLIIGSRSQRCSCRAQRSSRSPLSEMRTWPEVRTLVGTVQRGERGNVEGVRVRGFLRGPRRYPSCIDTNPNEQLGYAGSLAKRCNAYMVGFLTLCVGTLRL